MAILLVLIAQLSGAAPPAKGAAQSQAGETTGNLQAEPQWADTAERLGPFLVEGQSYTVLLRKKQLREIASQTATEQAASETLSGLEIRDTSGKPGFQESFPYTLSGGRFSQPLTAWASLFSGSQTSALLIRFIEQPANLAGAESAPARESWQLFGSVNGGLVPFGAVLPLGQGSNITVGGVVTGVMVTGGIAVVPLASTAERLEFRVWTGNFYAFVPVRVDWSKAEWGEAEQCYELQGGTLHEKGCSMRVDARRTVSTGGADSALVRLFAATDEDVYKATDVEVRSSSTVDFLEVLAKVHWGASGGRVECSFSNLWLRVRIDGQIGWVEGEEAFRALGLPRTSPQ